MNVATRGNNSVLTKGNTDLITVNRIGNGLKFDGVNDYVLIANAGLQTNYTSSFSISFTIKYSNVIDFHFVTTPILPLMLYKGIEIRTVGNQLQLYMWVNGGRANYYSINFIPEINRIYDTVITFSNGICRFYIDNILQISVSNVIFGGYLTTDDTTSLNEYSIMSQISYPFYSKGFFYDLKIFNKTLNQFEVTQLYTSFGNNISGLEANIVANYNFNQKSGTILTDNSPNQLHGTLTNFGATSNLGGGAWVNSLGNTITY